MVPDNNACAHIGQRRLQHLARDRIPRPQIRSRGDPTRRFLATDPHPGGQHICPGFATDLLRTDPGHQRRLDAVIDHRLGAGDPLPLGLHRQQFRSVEPGEIDIGQGRGRSVVAGQRALHCAPSLHQSDPHDSNTSSIP